MKATLFPIYISLFILVLGCSVHPDDSQVNSENSRDAKSINDESNKKAVCGGASINLRAGEEFRKSEETETLNILDRLSGAFGGRLVKWIIRLHNPKTCLFFTSERVVLKNARGGQLLGQASIDEIEGFKVYTGIFSSSDRIRFDVGNNESYWISTSDKKNWQLVLEQELTEIDTIHPEETKVRAQIAEFFSEIELPKLENREKKN